jgi:DNA-binding transcriptional LysR family regulator
VIGKTVSLLGVELRHLRYFIAVAELKGFSHASRQLYVAQSAISQQIADLEHELGVTLLSRNRRQVALTEQGEVFLDEARKIIANSDRAIEMVRRSARGEIGTLRIGFFTNGVGEFFSDLIRAFRRRRPEVKLTLFEMAALQQMEALANDKIDVAFTRPIDRRFEELVEAEVLFEEPIVAILPRGHPLAPGPVPLSSLASEPFVLIDRDAWPSLFDAIITLCSQAGFSPRIVNVSGRTPAVLTLVAAGEGIALMTAGVKRFLFTELVFCPVVPTSSLALVIAWRTKNKSKIVEDFLGLVRASRDQISNSGNAVR